MRSAPILSLHTVCCSKDSGLQSLLGLTSHTDDEKWSQDDIHEHATTDTKADNTDGNTLISKEAVAAGMSEILRQL